MAKTLSNGRLLRFQAGLCLLILLLLPMQTMAEQSVLPVLDCPDTTLNQAESLECSVDLSDYVGISTIRYEFVSADSITSQTYSSVLATGGSHSCAILDNGNLKCWGSNQFAQSGQDPTISGNSNIYSPQLVDLGVGRTASSVSLGYLHSCAILDDGSVKCWGDNSAGVLGIGDCIPLYLS